MADIGNSNGPVQGPPIRISCDFRAFNAARPNLLSAFAHFNRSRGQDSVFSEPARSITADPAPAPVRRTEKDIEATPYEAASLHCSGKLAVKPEEAHQEPSTRDGVSQENGASAEINDSALGESLSEPDVQGTPAPPSALIVKFSTTSPGRINGIERQGPIPSNKQSLCQSADQRRKSFNLPNGPQTPLASAQKRRGRPPGSKNKSPFKRSEADWYIAGRENHPAPPQFLYGPREDAHPEESRPRQSGIMRAIWAKRHSNGTDGHWGGPPTDRTVLQRERKTGLQGYAGTPCGRPNSNDPRQAGHQSHPTSASTLPAQASRSANVMHHTVEPGVFNHTNVQAQRAGPSFPSELPALCIKDVALRDVFCAYIYPSLVKARSRHQGTLPSETLDSLYKQVSLATRLSSILTPTPTNMSI